MSVLPTLMNHRGLWLIVVLALTAVLGMRLQLRRPYPDTDQFYHFAISRMTVEQGLIRQLPQVTGIGWDDKFPDKEFLFHMLTAAGHRVFGGDQGVRRVAILLASVVAGSLYWLCSRYITAAISACISLGLFVLDPFSFNRIFLVRPYLLAVFCVMVLVAGLIGKRPVLAGVGGLLFALSYHALHITLILIVLTYASTLIIRGEDNASMRRTSCVAFAGLCAGTLINPYFPEFLSIGWAHFRFAFETEDPAAPVGDELRRLSVLSLIVRSPVLFAVVLVIVLHAMVDVFRGNIAENKTRLCWSAAALLFTGAAILNPRALEYLIPLAAISLAMSMERMRPPLRWALCGVLVIGVAVQSAPIVMPYFSSSGQSVNQGRLSAIRAVSALPSDEDGAIVFNCTYNTGPYLLNYRPNVRFIDLLDPRLYRRANRSKYALRNELVHGKLSDPYKTLRTDFDADYVVCMCDGLISQMQQDPRFEKLYPPPNAPPNTPSQVQTYKLLDADAKTYTEGK